MKTEPLAKNEALGPPDKHDQRYQVDAKTKRVATVFDAVAGRITTHGFISKSLHATSFLDTSSVSSVVVPPEEALFRRRNAPERYEENDFYFANDHLPENTLPHSDLLKALHCYTSDFYTRTTADEGKGDYRSMDETALLALGILIEESCRETLGKTGDMVFTEGELQEEGTNGRGGDEFEKLGQIPSSGRGIIDDGYTLPRPKRRRTS